MKETEGNLIDMALEGKFEVIIHGCNCFNTMGSGIAGQIKRRLPEAYAADQETVKGDKSKLGTYSSAEFSHGDIYSRSSMPIPNTVSALISVTQTMMRFVML